MEDLTNACAIVTKLITGQTCFCLVNPTLTDYEYICMVINGKTRSVSINISGNVCMTEQNMMSFTTEAYIVLYT